MRLFALSFGASLLAVAVSCTDTTVEDVGTFKITGQTYVIQSTTPGNSSEANARDQAVYSAKFKDEKLICNGSTSDCRAVTEQRLRDLESDEAA